MSRNHRRNRRIKRKRRKGWIWIVFILVAMLLAAGFWMLSRNYEGTGKDEYKSKPTAEWKETAETDRQSKSQDESTSDFYFRQLSEEEQHIYTSLLKGVSSHRESVEILGAETDKLSLFFLYLLLGFPQIPGVRRLLSRDSYKCAALPLKAAENKSLTYFHPEICFACLFLRFLSTLR